MPINEPGSDYFESGSLLSIGFGPAGNNNTLSVLQLGLLNGQSSGATIDGTLFDPRIQTNTVTQVDEGTVLEVGEAFTVSRTSVRNAGVVRTEETLQLTMAGSGVFRPVLGLGGPFDIVIGVDAAGDQYVIFPNGDMPSGLVGAVVGALVPVIEVRPVGYDFGNDMIVCFARGTLIDTPTGPRAIEDLAQGDLVLTRDGGAQPLRWIGHRTITAAVLTRHDNLRPIRIAAGALGANTPTSDLIVSPQHRILVRSKIARTMFGTNEVLVAAKQLLQLDGIDVCDVTPDGVDYFHMLFDTHQIVVSNGAETESMFTGPEALKTVGQAALDEIFAIFPELQDDSHVSEGARMLISGKMARKLAVRHAQHHRDLVS